jgi:hypothetical protein
MMSVDLTNDDPVSENWHSSESYAALHVADRTAFAWEWLRRSPAYRLAWRQSRSGAGEQSPCSRDFGLERFENPDLATPYARPLWSASVDPMVITASVVDPLAAVADRIDLRLLSRLVSLAIDDEQVEHLLLSDGKQSLRIDIVEGTLIGCPSSLRYALEGIARLRGPLTALDRLMSVVESREFGHYTPQTGGRHARWILELQVADALAAGATHQEIARALFTNAVADRKWRTSSASYRQRVHRLVTRARLNLREPLHERWFGNDMTRRSRSDASGQQLKT